MRPRTLIEAIVVIGLILTVIFTFCSVGKFYLSLPVVGMDSLTKECVYIRDKGVEQMCDDNLPPKYLVEYVDGTNFKFKETN